MNTTSMRESRTEQLSTNILNGVERILVPVAMDERSRKLAAFAATLAEALQAHLILLHVFKSFEFAPAHSTAVQYDQVNEALKRNADAALAEFRASMADYPKIRSARIVTKPGFVEDAICKVAGSIQVGLVVLSTHGYTGIKHFAYGSKAEDVLRHSPCPVLVIPDSCLHQDQQA